MKTQQLITSVLRPKRGGGPPISIFSLYAKVEGVLEELDGWLRRKLRTLLWRQWKRVYRRALNLMKAGIGKERAWRSATTTNGHGPWWNGGASHLDEAYPKSWFDQMAGFAAGS
jgi:RNA-directed DNA polymerase